MYYRCIKSFVAGLACMTGLLLCEPAAAQLKILENKNAQELAQRLAGDGVIIRNAVLTGANASVVPTGYFQNIAGTNIGIDSGIVLTTGRAKTSRGNLYGLDGNGTFAASLERADENLGMPGDADLANEIGMAPNDVHDAVALEFDFVPLGDSIRFNYVMSSEEYTEGTVCYFNDAFGFFISGPGITGLKNIALIPGTNTPVSISNVNNITTASCVSYPQYYIDNSTNIHFIHEGHTVVFTAIAKVQPCETYHLKLVIADINDHYWDSGVFLEAKSLNSNAATISSNTQTDNTGTAYLAEGCAQGTITVRRPRKESMPAVVKLLYGGTAVNGTDVQLLPASVTIPANDSIVTLPVHLIADGTAEGIEELRVYTLAGCTDATVADSTIFQLRDQDTLALYPKEALVCRKDSIQLHVMPGYISYQWTPANWVSNPQGSDPFVKPQQSPTHFVVTAMDGSCPRRDSSVISMIPPVRVFAGNDTTAVFGQPLQLQATVADAPPGMQYSWSPALFLDDPTSAMPVATLQEDYWYLVTAITPEGCMERDDIRIKVYKGPDIYVPSGFTPNNDGLNDFLRPVTAGIRELVSFNVYNRWGQLVYSSRDPHQRGWDGKVKGVLQETGTFIWTAEAVDFKGNRFNRKGVVTIIR